MLWSIAHAQTAAPKQPSLFETMFPMILIFVIFYFLIIMPQRKQRKKHQEFLTGLKRGDQVITASGIFGTIEGITDTFVTLQIADNVKIKVLKSQVLGAPKEQQQ